jgi:hypothetical protein
VSNVGRRSVYFYGASLIFPRKEKRKTILLLDTTSGLRLDEGGRPEHFLVKYSDELADYRGDWQRIRAMAKDSGGKSYFSKYPKQSKPPWLT